MTPQSRTAIIGSPSAWTLAEAVSLGSGADTWASKALPERGVTARFLADGPHGVRKAAGITAEEFLDGEPATSFPAEVSLGYSWDPELLETLGRALGVEAVSRGVDVLLAPGINLKRDPRCGRNFEYLAEDPLLSGVLGAAIIRGVQSVGIGACVKHFAANNQETDRMRVSVDIDDRPLRELYLRSFERAIKAGQPRAVMSAYNRINGEYASENRWLLTEVLREQWGFEGAVISDWSAVHDRVAAVGAGLDLEMPGPQPERDAEVVAAVGDGRLSRARVDDAAARVLALQSSPEPGIVDEDPDAHHALARSIARRCPVLLKNEGELLPLDPTAGRIAVIGELAREPRFQGGGSAQVIPTRVDNAWDELQALGRGATLSYAPGTLGGDGDPEQLRAAVAAAADADRVLLFLGLGEAEESEGFDREHLRLPAAQYELFEEVLSANPNVAVVLASGGVVELGEIAVRAPAILACGLLGQAGGGAIADLVLGEASPSGRLSESMPLRLVDAPSYPFFPGEQHRVRYAEGLFVGYRGYDMREQDVAFPFGHGLSYTSFEYEGVKIRVEGDAIIAELEVHNTGSRDGHETVQLYTGLPGGQTVRAIRELRAFATVSVAAGTRRQVRLRVPRTELAHWDPAAGDWVVEGGEYLVEMAASSRDIRAQATVSISADRRASELTAEHTLKQWQQHPQGSVLIAQVIDAAKRRDRGFAKLLRNPLILAMARQMSIRQIVDFPGTPFTEEELNRLLAEAAEAVDGAHSAAQAQPG